MSLKGSSNPEADKVSVASFYIMLVGGFVTLPYVLPNLQNNNNGALAPLLFIEGVGLTLEGVAQMMIYQSNASKTRDTLRASGLVFLGLGIAGLGIVDFMTTDRFYLLTLSGITVTAGALCVGIAEDRGNLVKWKD